MSSLRVELNQIFTEFSARYAPIPDEVYSFQTSTFRELYDRLANL